MRARLMNYARKTRGRRCTGSASVPQSRSRPRTGRRPALPARPWTGRRPALPARPRAGRRPALPAGPGQAMAEFAFVAVILLGLTLAVIDLARAGLMQHDLDGGASDLARSLVAITGASSSGSTSTYIPTVLDPAQGPAVAAIPTALAHAVQLAWIIHELAARRSAALWSRCLM